MLTPKHPLQCAVALVAVASLPTVAATRECPTQVVDEKVILLLERASTCAKAMTLFRVCFIGGAGDARRSKIVIAKCEGEFLSKLRLSQLDEYEEAKDRCVDEQGDPNGGTSARALVALCLAELAQNYSRRFSRGSQR